ncbi:MAG: hypothetical protein J0653_00020, partial [Deltaproteobacteria bacterium]|nr:hypothetical protein [Deltaproteobacteria bacterium]
PSIPLFEIVRDKAIECEAEYGAIANFQQCVALIFAVLRDVSRCEEHLDKATRLMAASSGRREVSCWTFVEEPEEEFKKHCLAIQRLAQGKSEVPLFIEKYRGLNH